MRKWIIRHWYKDYDSVVFGTKFRHARVVNTCVPLFIIAGVSNLLIEGFGWFQALLFLPPVLLFFAGKLDLMPKNVTVDEFDWEQQKQYKDQTFTDIDIAGVYSRKELERKYVEKYKSGKSFVEAWRFFHPLAWIVAGLIIYSIFGYNEAGFYELRFF